MSRVPLTPDRLNRALEELGRADTASLVADVLATTGRTRQRRWSAPMWWLPQAGSSRLARRPAPLALALGLLLILALALALFAGGAFRREPTRPYLGVIEQRPPLLLARSGPVAVPLADGRVLVAGGDAADHGSTSTAQVYDPADGSSTQVGDLPFGALLGARLSDGRALLIGSVDDPNVRWEGELFDPSTGASATLPALRLSDDISAVFALADDKVLIVDFGTRGVRVFDARRGTLSDPSPMPPAVQLNIDIGWHGTSLADGRVLLAAETGGPMVVVDPDSMRIELAGPEAPVGPCLAGLQDGRAVVLGVAGLNPPSATRPVGLVYDAATDSARAVSAPPGLPDRCVPLRDGRVLVVAAPDDDGSPAADPVVFDPMHDSYAPTLGRAAPGGFEQVVPLADGDILLLNGSSEPASQSPGNLVGLFR